MERHGGLGPEVRGSKPARGRFLFHGLPNLQISVSIFRNVKNRMRLKFEVLPNLQISVPIFRNVNNRMCPNFQVLANLQISDGRQQGISGLRYASQICPEFEYLNV